MPDVGLVTAVWLETAFDRNRLSSLPGSAPSPELFDEIEPRNRTDTMSEAAQHTPFGLSADY